MTTSLLDALRVRPPAIVAIGASAGAVDALGRLLPELPPTLPTTLVVVVHVPPDRPSALAELFAQTCTLPTREAEDKLSPAPGVIHFAPPDYHLLVERDGTLALSVDGPVLYSRPSIDVLFESVADARGPHALGILLSGASRDGARGLARMHAAGAHTWVQDPDTAQVATMPRAALELTAHPTLDARSMGRVLHAWATRHA